MIPQNSKDTIPDGKPQHTRIDQFARTLTAHSQAIAEKVARVCYKDDQARLDFGVLVQARVLEHERAGQAKDDAERHRGEENEQEDAYTVEERQDVDLLAVELGECPAQSVSCAAATSAKGFDALEHDDSNRVIQYAFTEDDAI